MTTLTFLSQSLEREERGGLRAYEFRKADGSVGVCAWCQAEHGVQLDVIGQTSHGICPRHLAEMKAQLERRRLAAAG